MNEKPESLINVWLAGCLRRIVRFMSDSWDPWRKAERALQGNETSWSLDYNGHVLDGLEGEALGTLLGMR